MVIVWAWMIRRRMTSGARTASSSPTRLVADRPMVPSPRMTRHGRADDGRDDDDRGDPVDALLRACRVQDEQQRAALTARR